MEDAHGGAVCGQDFVESFVAVGGFVDSCAAEFDMSCCDFFVEHGAGYLRWPLDLTGFAIGDAGGFATAHDAACAVDG